MDDLDVLDGRDLMRREDPFGARKAAYPPRLMVDFTRLTIPALQRYARFYNLKTDSSSAHPDLAAQVARHFDNALHVEEHESIAAFVQRLRNGERGGNPKRQADKDRRLADKKRRKSASHKRQRGASETPANPAANGHSGAGRAAGRATHTHDKTPTTASHIDHQGGGQAGRVALPAAASVSAPSAATTKPTKQQKGKKTDKGGKDNEDNELYCICNLPSYGNMIACDGKKCPNPSQWYHLECVGLADGRHPDTWLCPECDPKGFAAFQSKKKKPKHRSKSPGAK